VRQVHDMSNTTELPFDELVAEAEKAVAGVKDPELRRAAFEKILDRLLGQTPAKKQPGAPKTVRSSIPRKARSQGGPASHLEELIEEGFFKQQRTLAQVKAELANRGHHVPQTSLSGPLQRLCQRRRLRRKILKGDADRAAYGYSNW
jgi:hypothetical protein